MAKFYLRLISASLFSQVSRRLRRFSQKKISVIWGDSLASDRIS